MENQFDYINNTEFSPQNMGFAPLDPKLAQKKEIRTTAMFVGIPILTFSVITAFWSTVYLSVMSVFGYSATEALKIIKEPALLQVVQIVLSILMFTVPYIVAAKIGGYCVSDLVPLERPKKGSVLPYFLFGIGFCAFANIAVSYAGSIFESFGIDYSVDFGDNPKGVWGFILVFISTAVVPARVEEFACRGIMFGLLLKHGQAFALIVSAIVFGLLHGNFEQIPFAFLVGLVLGLIRIKTGSLWVCVLVHGFNNLVSVVFSYLPDGNTMAQNMAYVIFLACCLAAAIYGMLSLSRDKDTYKLEKDDSTISESDKHKWFFTSPITIIFVVIAFVESLAFFL